MPEASPILLEDTVFSVEIVNKGPVELVDLTNSLWSLGEEFKAFAFSHPEYGDTSEARLYIKEIRTGSVKADLIALAAATAQSGIPLLGQTNTVIEFGRHLKAAYDYFTGKSKEKPVLQKTEYGRLTTIIETTAKDQGSQTNFTIVVNQNELDRFGIDSNEANAAQNVIQRELAALQEPERQAFTKRVLYWYQARNDPQSHVGDRGIIESVSPYPVKIDFEDESIKETLLHGIENPFLYGYVVDLVIETIKGKPVLYKIIRYHSLVDIPKQDELDLDSQPS